MYYTKKLIGIVLVMAAFALLFFVAWAIGYMAENGACSLYTLRHCIR